MASISYNNNSSRAIIPYDNDLPPEGISRLPQEMVMEICYHLGIQELGRLASTQRKFYFLVSSNVISNPWWKALFYKDYNFNEAPNEIQYLAGDLSFYELYRDLNQAVRKTMKMKPLPNLNDYHSKTQKFFKTKEELWELINKGQYEVQWIKVVDNRFLISSLRNNQTVTIWDLQYTNKEKLLELKTKECFINHIKIVDDILVFSLSDPMTFSDKVAFLDLKTKEKQLVESFAAGQIQCIKIVEKNGKKLIISGLADRMNGTGTIEIWNPRIKERFNIDIECRYWYYVPPLNADLLRVLDWECNNLMNRERQDIQTDQERI